MSVDIGFNRFLIILDLFLTFILVKYYWAVEYSPFYKLFWWFGLIFANFVFFLFLEKIKNNDIIKIHFYLRSGIVFLLLYQLFIV